jgi:amino acid adenylation domain-containing protein
MADVTPETLSPATVPARLSESAARRPYAPAVVSAERALTFADLDAAASRVARALRARGIGGEARVGVCMGRTPEWIASLLGVMRAGGAYLPLDPAYPPARLAYMLADSGAALVIADKAAPASLAEAGVPVVQASDLLASSDDSFEPMPEVDPEALAYVIYTSGSTGRPKGVGIPHRAITSIIPAMARAFGVKEDGRVLQWASPSFDASVAEVLTALFSGAALHLATREELMPGPGLARLLGERAITNVTLPPSALALLPTIPLDALRVVIAAGEACTAELVSRWAPGRAFVNAYGPTETAICATAARCEATGEAPSIGTAIDGASVFVFDGWDSSSDGELCVGGEGVARGYLGRPALTAERFVPDPFSSIPGARMYRTGDRVRVRADGALDFIGRVDEQVKVRGHRIEPGEVSAALAVHPGVAQAAVVADETPGGARLVAYFVPSSGSSVSTDSIASTDSSDSPDSFPSSADLRAFLLRSLPEYMVPSAFVALDAFPLTPNGKLDRAALPAPPAARPEIATPFVAPRSETERAVADVWAEVLGIDSVGADDALPDLGGTSLAAMRVLARVRDAYGVELPVAAVLGPVTVASVASEVEAALGAERTADVAALVPVPRGGDLPAAFGQERVWFITRLEPGNLSYHAHAAFELRGALDVDALRWALSQVVARHEVLRSTFPEVDGRPVQRIHAPWAVPLPVVDLTDVAEAERDAAAKAWMRAHFQERFDLEALPLVRWTLLKLAADRYTLVQVEHHIIHDGWSSNILLADLLELYRAKVLGRSPRLPELPVQFADFCVWQREWMRSAEARAQLEYWKARLADSTGVLELPLDRPRPPVQRYRGRAPRFRVPGALYGRLRDLGREHGATPYQVMLTGFATVLSRYAGQTDLNVGTGIAARRQREVEGVMGMFVNSLVFRLDLSGAPTFAQLLGRVRQTTLEAYARQDVPFDAVVEAVRPGRSLSQNPLVQVLFSYHDTEPPALELPGVEMGMQVALSNESAKFDLNVVCIPDRAEGGLELVWEYDADLFDGATMERMFAHFLALLQSAADRPGERADRLSMASDDERAAVDAWNATDRDYPRNASIPRVFSRRVSESPDAIAFESDVGSLTYAELDARANRLARRLRALGVGPDARVGLAMERSPELIVALVAILKAGGAYVPLDPEYPAERLAFMAADAGVSILIVKDEVPAALASIAVPVLSLSADAEAIGSESDADLDDVSVDAENLAYVVFTSGSTGRPKGVGVPHRAVLRLVLGSGFARMGADETWLQMAPVAFDASTLELWAPLLNGGRIAQLPAGPPTPETLGAFFRRHQVTSAWITAGLFHQIVDTDVGLLAPLRQLLAGGDVLSVPHARRVLEAHPHIRLINGYGPTENTTFTTCHPIGLVDTERGSIPIGSPIHATRVYVLDEEMRPAPVDVPGELYAAGDGLARGYLGRAALTAEAFVPSPFGHGERLYRTGDRVRWRGDGTLEFLGRLDAQVKVRGFRIELGEIESVLRGHPAVLAAAVAAREDQPGDRRLVAYVVPRAGMAAPSAAELRALAAERLPEYMVPAAFVALDTLPLNANGKVDRRALPAPGADAYAAAEVVAPRTPAEEVLAGIWAELLGIDRVGADDDFFVLGGHSLLAMRMLARVREAFGVEVPPRAVFEAPVLAALAERIDRERRARAEEPEERDDAPLAAVPRGQPLPLSFGQERLWFLWRMLPESPFYNVPTAWRIRGHLDAAALERAFAGIVARHEALRTTFAEADGRPVQVIHDAVPFILPVDDLTSADSGSGSGSGSASKADDLPPAVRDAVAAEASAPFDLARGPLMRARLLRLAGDDHVLVITLHHVVSDGWSIGILFRELRALYEGAVEGRDPMLAPLPVQYADLAAWQRGRLSGPVLARALGWWTRELAGAPPTLELPTDRPRPSVQRHEGGVVRFAVPADVAESLRALARREGSSLYMVLLAAFGVVLSRWSGQDDLVVGAPIAGRTRREAEGLIGFFVNTLALRLRLDGDPGFAELLRRVRRTTLEAYAHQELPFERLVEELQPERDLSRPPLAQVLFQLLNTPPAALSLPGVAADEVDRGLATAKAELQATLEETPDGLRGTLVYAAALFDDATVERLAGHYVRLLRAAVADPAARVSALPMLGEDELRRVTVELNDTDRPYPTHQVVTDLVEEQARRTPDAPALVFGDESLTYAELNARANRIAHHLRSLGVGPETMVGVCLERGPDLVAALLAVLKSGGAYLPLDPAYPAERIRQFLDDARAAVVLTHSSLAPRLPATAARVVRMDEEAQAINARPAGDPARIAEPENLAYVIYTSGSTGRPKGVQIEHRSAVALLHWMREWVPAAHRERVLFSTSVSFDVSIAEVFGTLAWGGTLVVVENALSLADLPDDARITRATMVPAAAAELLRLGKLPASLQSLGLGGEALAPALARALHAEGGMERVENLYGPTEDTTYSTWWIVPADARKVLVGRPVANTRAYVLDAHLRPVPAGAPGELYLAGAGLSRGYAGKPAATAERFLPDPFGPAGGRMYRTGDLARWTNTGELEYLGRRDFQVKVRGFRIELGEIEEVLASHPALRQAAVRGWTAEGGGETRLAAYVVARGGEEAPSATGLRAWLRERLPDFMVPAAFVALDALPLNTSGKVDRLALPVPEAEALTGGEPVATRTLTEAAVAGIWAEVLGVESVGVLHNFFDLGGHSLLATRVAARVRETLGVELPLPAVFEHQTVEALARLVDERLAAAPPAPAHDAVVATAAPDLVSRLGELSEAELDELLGDLR